jgi:hypothetical protein
MNSEDKFPRIPLVLGVTGHRMLRQGEEDQLRIRELIRQIFDEFILRYPHTPALLLSPLAKGADRLVAEVALENKYCNWCTLLVPMPFPETEYREDFKKDGSEKEFDQLLQAAGIRPGTISGRLFHMPVPAGADLREQAARNRQYAMVGEFVAHYCQVLIALWDGKISTATNACGAGAIVNFKLKAGVFPELSRLAGEPWLPPVRPLDVPQTGPVYHIRAPRESETIPREDIRLEKIFHHPTNSASDAKLQARQALFFETVFKQIDAFNGGGEGIQCRRSTEQLVPEEQMGRLTPELRALNGFYAVASGQSLRNQTRARALLLMTCFTAFLAVVAGCLRSQKLPQSEFLNDWTVLYVVCLAASAGCYLLSLKFKWPDKYQDYRALAEGLRVQFFWRLAGLKSSVSDHYLSKQKSELEWIRRAINNSELVARSAGAESSSPMNRFAEIPRSPETQQQIRQHWVKDQADFFESVLRRDAAELRSLKNMGQGLVIFALASVALFFGSGNQSLPAGMKRQVLPLLMAAIPTLAAVVLVVFKEWKKCNRQSSSLKEFWMGLWKIVCGIMTGFLFFGLLFDLPRLWPKAFDDWTALLSPTRMAMLVAACVLLADAMIQIRLHVKRGQRFFGQSRFLLAERTVVHCWHGFLAAVFLASSVWLYWGQHKPQHSVSTPAISKAATTRKTHERNDVLITVITVTLALGTLLQYYSEKKALNDHLRESARMKDLFERAAEKLNQRVFQPGEPDDPIKELGEEALLENGTWLLTHRERPLEIPKP